MKKKYLLILAAWPLAVISATGDYDAGVSAYNAGNYETALENWLPLARAALYGQGEDLHVAIWPRAIGRAS